MRRSLVTSVTALLVWGTAAFAADPLPSWNDGTLWAEQPMYFQAFFIFDRIKALHPPG
jgi:hypothetical protein